MKSSRLRNLLILVYVLYIVLKCHGFVPFKYNRKRKKFEGSASSTIYSAVVGTLFCVLFPLAVKRMYNNINTLPTTRALVSITLTILFLFLVSLVIFYFTIIRGRHKIVLILNGFVDLYDCVNRDYPGTDLVGFQTHLIFTQLKLIGLIMLLVYSLMLNLDNYTSSRLSILILCGVTIPSFALLVLCNLIIQAVLLLTAFLQRINKKLKKIQAFCDDNAGKRDAVRDCELSDEIDKMVNYYDRVYILLKDVRQLCSTQIFLFILNGLGNLITQVSIILQIAILLRRFKNFGHLQGFLVFLIGSTSHLRELSSNMKGMFPIILHFTIFVLYFYFFVQVCSDILLEVRIF